MQSEQKYTIDIGLSLENLCRHSGPCAADLQGFLPKQIWSPQDRQSLLQCLASLVLQSNCTVDVAAAFPGLVLDLLHRAKDLVGTKDKLDWVQHQRFCVALSKIVHNSSDARRFAVEYLTTKPPFYSAEFQPSEPVAKKSKKRRQDVPRLEIVHSVYRLVQCLCTELRQAWDWSYFLKYLQDSSIDTRWFAVHTLSLVLAMCPAQLQMFRDKHFSSQQQRQLLVKYDTTLSKARDQARPLANPHQDQQIMETHQTHTIRAILDADLGQDVVSVCGVLLPRHGIRAQTETEQATDHLVLVPSTRRNLHSLALAVAAGSPVLLEGPVGSGKTALVEHLAREVGLNKAPQLMKIQLGDQTDSKALLGTYRCTDVPGEFVWQSGSLTRAVLEGHWILLEDLDYAPMDVVSMLVSLLESNTLSCPGHGDQIRAAPGFRIFATQRLLSSRSGLFKSQHNTDILEKLWVKLTVEPLSREELQQVITSHWPMLTTVVDRLLDIYFLLSAGRHELSGMVAMETDQDQDVGRFLSHDGRMISTRDLMKWCSRIAVDFDVSKLTTSTMVFHEALDCFCACVSKTRTRLLLACAMATKLNISKDQADFYCNKYKPNIEISLGKFNVGRVSLPRKHRDIARMKSSDSGSFAFTRPAVALLELVGVCITNNEPVLLVGETGTGKTSTVQYLAQQTGHTLKVINMSQQSDSTDLMGGFKPVDLRLVVAPLREEFEMEFFQVFSRKQNTKFLGHLQEAFSKRRWADLFGLMEHSQKAAVKKCKPGSTGAQKWEAIGRRLRQLKLQVKQSESALAFSFIEGTLVKALKNGDWVLLDEINLATAETLECLSGLLESTAGSVVLLERGDTEPIVRHQDFRLFACMNPATDVGKKDLPPGVRNRFTEVYVDELETSQDLKVLVAEYLKGLSLSAVQVEGIVKFYQVVRTEAAKRLADGTGHKPHYSLRTLCRALRQAASNMYGSVPRSLYEGFCLSFLSQVNRSSHPLVEQLIRQHIVGKAAKSLLTQVLPEPPGGKHLQFEGYWLARGSKEPFLSEEYVLTPSVRANLRDLVRIVAAGRYPVLLQGETSVGKTSLISWLAQASGSACVRINNHEHTDLQEYVGCYAASESGKLLFKEGVLVEAMRKGYWIILDELNLAPSDVLEALNRLLDDNRELFIPETQEVVKAHPKFMLFATQNPPGQYGGRKVLSRAFRNRFVELHFDEIPSPELETILHQRCVLPHSYCRKLVAVMLDLQTRRRSSGVFAGKQGFITLRDLFRWAERYRHASSDVKEKYFDWDQLLADNGYMLLAGRVRHPEECAVIREVIQKHIKRKVSEDHLFTLSDKTSPTTAPILREVTVAPPGEFQHVVWTYSMRRMAVLMGQAVKFGEPVLLVGDTGCGKTTLCQLYAALRQQQLHSVNCHLHTESSDFLGGLHPVRHRQQDDGSSGSSKLFEWCDGPLVQAMQQGTMFLIDEISLADDSVLERLNSVLEPERTLLLAEKAGGDGLQNEVEEIVAMETFRVVGTMNPGGDYGKKELSPALRNRFTEIWCPHSGQREDMVAIIEHNVKSGVQLCNQQDGSSGLGSAIMDFLQWFSNNELGRRSTVSIRDILSWVHFINTTARTVDAPEPMADVDGGIQLLDPALAYIHGACMVFLDALGSGSLTSGASSQLSTVRSTSLRFLADQIQGMTGLKYDITNLAGYHGDRDVHTPSVVSLGDSFGIEPFYIPRGPLVNDQQEKYALSAPTTCLNAQRILRALQLTRPILLEGSPGVGKTSLVAAIAKAAGHELVRINLSEQTDVSDLFGADLPVEGAEGGQFAWRDGPLLRALKAGHWIVLDELNLASQSVLEGLNACLDHRAEIYVPELAMTFQVLPDKTRLFACQNPLNQGGGRKGLPRSFLNRFTQVYVEPLSKADLQFITQIMYPQLPAELLAQMIDFNQQVYQETMVEGQWGQRGSPWEFNLRDIFRWCDLLLANQAPGQYKPSEYVGLVYSDRMRTSSDKQQVYDTFPSVFGSEAEIYHPSRQWSISTHYVQVGHSVLPRSEVTRPLGVSDTETSLQMLHHMLPPMESLMKCIEMNWMTILIGGAGSGKTSLVRLLAQLTGHPLHVLPMNSAMDTTELLGGFEQSDLNRHLEQVQEQVQQHVQEVTSQVLLANQKEAIQSCQKILSTWTKYTTLVHEPGSGSSSSNSIEDEVAIVQRKLGLLTLLISQLAGTPNHNRTELETLHERVGELERQLKEDKSTNHGGMFEWIDSVLVNALRDGHWLLIDNVNFCSPSVLDRLNALLEPNGVLIINERGVIDGEIPSIKPHPNFRLMLAMDPRHGEISRAMRNRGIEIYMLGENEAGGNYSAADLTRMLHGLGVIGRVPCQSLLELHNCLQSTTEYHAHFALADLLRVGLLSWQQMDRGVDVKTAMLSSCFEVYVRGQHNPAFKQQLAEVITQHFSQWDVGGWERDHRESGLVEAGMWPDPLPDSRNWCGDVSLATVRQNSGLILHLVNCWLVHTEAKTSVPLTFTKLLELDQGPPALSESFAKISSLFVPTLKVAIEATGLDLWETMRDWLLHATDQRLGASQKSAGKQALDIPRRDGVVVKGLGQLVKAWMQAVFQHPLMNTLREGLQLLAGGTQESDCLLMQQPFDLRWNRELLRRFQTKLAASGRWNQELEAVLLKLPRLSNQLYLIGRLALLHHVHMYGVDNYTAGQKQSLLQLSHAFHQGQLTAESLPHPVALHVYPLVSILNSELSALLQDDCSISDDDLQDLLGCLQWYDRLMETCLEPWMTSGQQRVTDQLAKLSLHWSFFTDRCLAPLMDSHRFSTELQSVVKQLDSLLGTEKAAWQLHQLLWRGLGHPAAFTSQTVATLHLRLHQLCDLISIGSSGSSRRAGVSANQIARVQFALTRGTEFRAAVLQTLLEVAGQNEKAVDDVLQTIETRTENLASLLKEQGLQLASPSSALPVLPPPPPPPLTPSDLTSVALWPLNEHLALRGMQALAGGALKGVHRKEVERLVDWTVEHTQVNPAYLLPWKILASRSGSDKDSTPEGVDSQMLSNFFTSLWTSLATSSVGKWLSWQPSSRSDMVEWDGKSVVNIGNGAPFLFCAGMTYIAFTLLTDNETGGKQVTQGGSTLPSNISLGTCQEKLSQLSAVSRQLWMHSGMWSSSEWDPCKCSCELLLRTVQSLASAACAALPDQTSEGLRACLTDTTLPNTGETLNEIGKVLSSTELAILLPTNQTVASRCVTSLQNCVKVVLGEPIKSEDTLLKMCTLGEAWAYAGLLQSFLLVPQGPVDPAEEVAVLLGYTEHELVEVKQELFARNWDSEMRTGEALPLDRQELLHPLLLHLVRRQETLTQQSHEMAGQVAFRPHPPQFQRLLQEVKQFLQTHGSVTRVTDLIEGLRQGLEVTETTKKRKKKDGARVRKLVQEQKAWHGAAWEFVHRLQEDYPLYRDLLLPFVSGVMQMLYGLSIMGHAVDCKQRLQDLLPQQSSQTSALDDVMCRLARFPSLSADSPSSLALAQTLLSDDVIALVRHLVNVSEDGTGADHSHVSLLMKAALLSIRNHAATQCDLDPDTLTCLGHVLDLYVTSWQRSEEERRLKEEEEASLFRYKSQLHGDDLTEEEHDEREILETFPSFDKEFDDITVGFTLQDKPKHGEPAPESPDDDTAVDVTVSQTQMQEICQLHCQLFTGLIHCGWHQGEPGALKGTVDYVEPALACYQVAAHLGKQYPDVMLYKLDGEIVGSHLLLSHVLQSSVNTQSTQANQAQKPHDVYRDPNVAEASQCRPLLEAFLQRIHELLTEWPDHPTLKQLVIISERILAFPVVSPLMKFVSGLEILLQKAQEWEANAARHVSLQSHLTVITQMIIQWRKLELRCWNSCLDTVAWKAEQRACKWWFHLYQLTTAYLRQQPAATESESDASTPSTPSELLQALQQFMEGSTLGEFSLRLRLILTFHCQLTTVQASTEQETLVKLLWNVYQFYKQFLPQVQASIAKLRGPIEKELKGFVKIARWNDINFYALKQAVEKIHQTLHKQMKRFDNILRQPAKPVFIDATSSDWTTQPQSVEDLDIGKFAVDFGTLQVVDFEGVEAESLLGRLPSLSKKMHKHCGWLLAHLPYPQLVETVEEFTGDIIESVRELQALDVSQIDDKKKQKSEAKHIHMRKRKALSDLFKYLQTLGLSYRKGTLALKEGDPGQLQQMLTQPLDLDIALTQLQQKQSGMACDPETAKTWQGCQKYQLRCVSRRALFHSVLASPSKELGLGNLERSKGFSEHLMTLVQDQWTRLAGFAATFSRLRHLVASVQRVASSPDKPLPPQGTSMQYLRKAKELCCRSVEVLKQTELMLECCPQQSADGSTVTSPLACENLAAMATVKQGDEAWTKAVKSVQSMSMQVQGVKTKVDKELATGFLLSWEQMSLLDEAYSVLQSFVAPLSALVESFSQPGCGLGSSLSQGVVFLRDNIQAEHSNWLSGKPSEETSGDGSAADPGFLGRVDDLIAGILLAVQTLVKTQRSNEGQEAAEEDHDVQPGHLTQHLLKGLRSNVGALGLEKVCSNLETVVQELCDDSNHCSQVAPRAVSHCLPLLEQYCHLVQYHLTEAVASHRTSAKLLSVLLGIFTELAQKGFCLPEEYSDEVDGEGATEFKDIEGGGLGEGEGAKDVSDQIETEDQLEDAQKAGEEKKEDDPNDQPDVAPEDNAIEMSGDIDGKLHDLEKQEGDEDENQEDEMDENDLDKQMGDLEGNDADKLDEQVWGSDEEEEEKSGETKEESGPGAGAESKPELVAKDDNQDKSEAGDKEQEKGQEQGEEDGQKEEEEKTHNLDHLDEREYDDNEVDPHHGDTAPQEEVEAMDLPEDLALDEEEEGGKGKEEQAQEGGEENELDLDKMADAQDTEDQGQEEEGEGQDDEGQEVEGDQQEEPGMEEEKEEDNKDDAANQQEEPMEIEDQDGESANQQPGFQPQDDIIQDVQKPDPEEQDDQDSADNSEAAQHAARTEHDTENVQQSEGAKDSSGANNEDEQESQGVGMADSEQQQGNQGDGSFTITRGQDQEKQSGQNRPGQSREERSLGTAEENVQRRLKTVDSTQQQNQRDPEDKGEDSSLFEHIQESKSQHDVQTLDSATADQQQQQQAVPNLDQEDEAEKMEEDDQNMQPDDTTQLQEEISVDKLSAAKLKTAPDKPGDADGDKDDDANQKVEIGGEKTATLGADRGDQSTFHTAMENYTFTAGELDIERLRVELEQELHTQTLVNKELAAVEETWHMYEALTASLSQELCEQLRLLLEPSQASRLRGDYRTGKRLNMRKVIPYIASQFRKDKIWLRRTKPSKRQYQVMVAVDDSSSMADNHSKQLAFESLAVIANALTLLEVGELGVASFGESVQVLHPFHEQFSSQSGATILQQFTFEQQKTKIALLLQSMTEQMVTARARQRGAILNPETCQLLLVISDGRGLFLEGMDVVKSAVRQAHEANIFIIFVCIDSPTNKDSILDIRVPFFRGSGQVPEIKSYMDSFPFPFYIILRDVNSLPHTLSDALRQWFELVTAVDM